METNIAIFQKLVEAYDKYFGDTAVDADKLTDEQIDEILAVQSDMDQAMWALILAKKIYAERRLIAEKNEALCKTIMHRIMRRQDVKEYECQDGKAKFVPAWQFEVDMVALPEDYKMHSYGKINAAITKWEKIQWVTVLAWHPSIRIS